MKIYKIIIIKAMPTKPKNSSQYAYKYKFFYAIVHTERSWESFGKSEFKTLFERVFFLGSGTLAWKRLYFG